MVENGRNRSMGDAKDDTAVGHPWARQHEVLQRKGSGDLYHVTARFLDIDREEHRYEVQDDTHTTREFWYEEDLKDEFSTIGVVVYRKPKHVLDGRLYDAE